MKSKLSNAVCYLSDSMEASKDWGMGWRKRFTEKAKSAGLNLVVLNPADKPAGLMKEGKDDWAEVRRSKDYPKIASYVKQIRRVDLRMVDLSDFLVVMVDKNVHACGTYDETFTAEDQHKPIFVICEGGLDNLPQWLFDVVNFEEVFDSDDALIKHLVDLDSGAVALDDRWVLIRDYLKGQFNAVTEAE